MRSIRTVCASIGLVLSACSAPVESGQLGDSEEPAADGPVGTVEQGLSSCVGNIDPLRSTMIVHPNIVNDPRASSLSNGAWSFRRLIENIAPSASQADTDAFIHGIFDSWMSDQIINGQATGMRPRAKTQILDLFTIAGTNPAQLDLSLAPFRLLAIASRLDLRSATSAGEGRLIYGLDGVGGTPAAFTIIFEFSLPYKTGLETPAKWAAKWHELDSIDPATQAVAFASKLNEITDNFTVRGAFAGRPNGSAVSQIRTNEFALGVTWQMREFNMGSNGLMAPAPTQETPNWDSINQSQTMRDFIAQNPALNTTSDTSFMSVKMPTKFGGKLFLGGRVFEGGSDWQLSSTEDRFTSVPVDNFGLLTCNGCHNDNKAIGDFQFYQVDPFRSTVNPQTGVDDGTGRLSGFMLEGDPSKGGRRPAELTRRASDMASLLCAPNQVDYVVSNITWSPANPAPGQATSFSATITNLGKATKPAGTINGVRFEVDGLFVTWSDNNAVALAPGASVTVTATSGPSGSATWNATSGRHTITAWVDDVNRVAELDENNNRVTAQLSPGVDLTVTNITWSPVFPSVGTAIPLSATIKNEGTVATQAGVIHGVRFEVDGLFVTWSDNSTASLAPGASRTVTASGGPSGSATWTATSGQHRLGAWVDDANRLPDVDRSNNKVETVFTVF
jgi:hypothetical protein